MSNIEQIADDIFVLTDMLPIDGRVSWIPPSAKGLEPHNSYVILSDDRALLIDTGVAAREDSLLASLRRVIGNRRLSIFITRIELDCLGNLARLLEVIPGTQVMTSNVVPLFNLIHPVETTPPPLPPRRILIGSTLVDAGFPCLKIYEAVVRTLGSTWLWEKKSGTLFTTDIFNTDMLAEPTQSVLHREEEDSQSAQTMREFILQKFDWLEFADTSKLAKIWDHFFSQVEPSIIAPIHGRIQLGGAARRAIENYRRAIFALQTERVA
ncbi:MAG: hypothetical protein GEU91_05940 [Rhizobiales bacterium]|nr:hypothetical protein [Hyphomicrobiales bacterium]